MRKYYWYFSAFWNKHGKLIVSSVVLAILIFSLFIPLIANTLETKKRMYIGLVGDYSINTLPLEIQTLISSGLTSLEEDGSASPAIATRWTVEDDGLTYRFVINKDLFWQDGKELTPDDIAYNFNDVETITTQNDIVFKLPDEYVPFPTTVAQPIFRTIQEPYLLFFKRNRIIGLGEYEVLQYVQTEQQLQRNSRLKELVLDSPQERRIYRFYVTENEAITAFKQGKVDILQNMTSAYDLANWANVQTAQTLSTDTYLAVFFNLNDPLFPKNIRQALYYSLQKPTDNSRADSPINPTSWAYLDGAKAYEYDLNRATERILSSSPELPLQFSLTTTPNFASRAEDIKRQWEDFGQHAATACLDEKTIEEKAKCENLKIQVSIKISNYPDTNDFQAILMGQKTPADPDQYYLWHSDQQGNFMGYKNTRIDNLLEKGRQTQDETERKAIYQEFQQFLVEDAPVIFLEYLKNFQISRT